MSSHQRRKGKVGELEAVQALRILLADPSIHRILKQTREGGDDLEGDSLRHFQVEVKRVNRPRLLQWFDSLVQASGIPLVMWRPDGKPWRYFVELPADELARLVTLINLVRDGRHLIGVETGATEKVEKLG